METSSLNNPKSRYVWGGSVDETTNKKLGWWERRNIPKSDTDIRITITPEYDRKPSLLAFDLYGKDTYGALILQYNNILDINTEFVTGVEIVVPPKSRVEYDIINKQSGDVTTS